MNGLLADIVSDPEPGYPIEKRVAKKAGFHIVWSLLMLLLYAQFVVQDVIFILAISNIL